MQDTKNKILHILRSNARLSNTQIAAMIDVNEDTVRGEIAALEESGIIAGYSAIINEEKLDKNSITVMVELKVSPQFENGYSAIAKKIAQYREVVSVRLMSGGFDLFVTARCDNFHDAAMFVAEKLAVMDGVLSTATHFTLQRFKEKGAIFSLDDEDERSLVSP